MWPVDDPPKPKLRTNVAVGPAQTSVVFNGPLNVLAALHACQRAAVELKTVSDEYTALKTPDEPP